MTDEKTCLNPPCKPFPARHPHAPRSGRNLLTAVVASSLVAAVAFAALWKAPATAQDEHPAAAAQKSPMGAAPAVKQHADSLSTAFRQASEAAMPAVVQIHAHTNARQPQLSGDSPDGMQEFQTPDGRKFFFKQEGPEGGRGQRRAFPGGRNPFQGSPFEQFFGGEMGDMFEGMPGMDGMQMPPQDGAGSGVIIDAAGVILTNRHVVEGADEVVVRLSDDREFKAEKIKVDPQTDLAVLWIDAEGEKLPTAAWGDSDGLSIGDWVLAIGHPFNLEATVSAGIISGKGRALDSVQRSNFLQTDAAINPGNSGGPLINLDAQIVGINTAIATHTGTYSGIGFAIPASTAKWVAGELMEHGRVRRAFLGVGIGEIGADLAARFGVKRREGVVVTEVHSDTPAAEAGVQEGDVILDFNGQRVGTPRELQAVVEQAALEGTHKLNVLRDGEPLALSLQLKELPESLGESRPARFNPEQPADEPSSFEAQELGLEVSDMPAEVARQMGYEGKQGVLISNVDPDSVAGREGLREGMLVLKVGKQHVANVQEFEEALKQNPLADGILLQVRTPQGNRFLVLNKL